MYLLDEPERVKPILRPMPGAADLRPARRGGVDAVLISSAFAGGGFISPRQYASSCCPTKPKSCGGSRPSACYTHTCGDIGDRLEWMADTGTDGIDTLDPPRWRVDLADAKQRVGDRVFFKEISIPSTRCWRDAGLVYADAIRRLEIGSRSNGFILSSAVRFRRGSPRRTWRCSCGRRRLRRRLSRLASPDASEGIGPR